MARRCDGIVSVLANVDDLMPIVLAVNSRHKKNLARSLKKLHVTKSVYMKELVDRNKRSRFKNLNAAF